MIKYVFACNALFDEVLPDSYESDFSLGLMFSYASSEEVYDAFREAVAKDMADPEFNGKGLANYTNPEFESFTDKVSSIVVKTLKVGSSFDSYAQFVIECIASSELSEDELYGEDGLQEFIIGQMSDGWGEGFEQHSILSVRADIDYEDEEEGTVFSMPGVVEYYASPDWENVGLVSIQR